ncbi:MAG: site-specific DNA-methyltransferase [Ktedonobacteraceae bacterium]
MAELTWKNKISPLDHAHNISSLSSYIQTQEHFPAEYKHEFLDIHHPPTTEDWQNRLIFGDKCDILPALLHEFTAKVNLVYIDPPFMTGRVFTNGSQVVYRDTWNNDIDVYLQWLYDTLTLLYALLSERGSIYVHLDWRTAHYAKLLLDEVFQKSQQYGGGFRNEIIWHYQSGGRSQKGYARKHDTLLLYTKSSKACFHGERIGKRRGTEKRNNMRKEVGADGRISWTIRSAGRLYTYDEDSLMTPSDVWDDIHHLHQRDPERTGYATQKPEALLERIIAASSEEQDLVLDCFCGSGVTPIVAEKLKRRWIACDKSTLSISTTRTRLLASTSTLPFVLQQVVK